MERCRQLNQKHLSEGLSPKLGGTAAKIVLFSFGEDGLFLGAERSFSYEV
jgi:hypothetical protein